MASRVAETGVDERGLGRYAWTKFEGWYGHAARILSIYVPCRTIRASGDLTVMNQHRRHFDKEQVSGCLRDILLDDVRSLLQEWRLQGERLIVFIDANENITNGPFNSMLTHHDLGLREAVTFQHPDPRWRNTGTYCKGHSTGRFPIDGVYVTPDLPVETATWLQFLPALGDHRFAVLDVRAQALVGENPLTIIRPPARRLSSAISSAMQHHTR
jgi:hypothetical protein